MDWLEWNHAKAALGWQIDLGVTEAILDTPMNRYDAPAKLDAPAAKPVAPVPKPEKPAVEDPITTATTLAKQAQSLPDLQAALDQFHLCDLRKGAKSLVFADGTPGARVMIVGEAPGRDEDIQAKPFVGRAGQLLDKMLAAIDLDRTQNVYITNILPWRPPQNRDPKPDEIAMMMPFVRRHVQLAAPDVLILMGNISCQAILGKRGITRLRGQWTSAMNKPTLPMCIPRICCANRTQNGTRGMIC